VPRSDLQRAYSGGENTFHANCPPALDALPERKRLTYRNVSEPPAPSLHPCQPSFGAAEAQLLLKHFANIFWKNDLRAFARLASCCRRATFAVTRGRQKGVNFAGAELEGATDNLPHRIDVGCHNQEKSGTDGNEGVEVRHLTVLPEEGALVSRNAIKRRANYLAPVVDAESKTVVVSWDGQNT